jgi:hypothetical protein
MLEEKECWIKQEFLNKWNGVPGVSDELKNFLKEWNKARCKSERAWTGEQKRPSSKDEDLEEEQLAAPPSQIEGQTHTFTEAQSKYGAPQVFPSKSKVYDNVVFPDAGAYGVLVKEDGVIGTGQHLLLLKGVFETGDKAQQVLVSVPVWLLRPSREIPSCTRPPNPPHLPRVILVCVRACSRGLLQALADPGVQTWTWEGLTSMDNVCIFAHDIPKATFPRKPSKLSEFVTWLEQNQKVRMTCDMHAMVKKGKVWSIKPDKKLTYKVLGLDESHKEKPSDQNAGSLLKVSDIMKDKRLIIRPRMRYVTKRNAFEAQRPGIYLKEPMRVRKGMWVPLVIPTPEEKK